MVLLFFVLGFAFLTLIRAVAEVGGSLTATGGAPSILDLLKQKYKYVGSMSGGRHLFMVPRRDIEEHTELKQLRDADPKKIDLLQSSMKRMGGSLYQISVFVDIVGGALKVYVVDGHQRLRAETQNDPNGNNAVEVQYVERWTTVLVAFREAVDLNFARYEVGEDDIISLLRTGKLTAAEVASRTGYAESTIREFAVFAGYDWAVTLNQLKAVPRTRLAKLISACANNPEKITALQNTLSDKLTAAQASAKKIAAEIKANKNRKYSQQFKDRAKVSHYFKDESWDAWVEAIEAEPFCTKIASGRRTLEVSAATGKKAGVWVGEDADWAKQFAVYDFFGRNHDDILLEDMQMVRDSLPDIKAKLDHIIKLRKIAESKADDPAPTMHPQTDLRSTPPPVTQSNTATVGEDDDE